MELAALIIVDLILTVIVTVALGLITTWSLLVCAVVAFIAVTVGIVIVANFDSTGPDWL